eukprot:3596848-Alexandrium_andersonii.AAC.1
MRALTYRAPSALQGGHSIGAAQPFTASCVVALRAQAVLDAYSPQAVFCDVAVAFASAEA